MNFQKIERFTIKTSRNIGSFYFVEGGAQYDKNVSKEVREMLFISETCEVLERQSHCFDLDLRSFQNFVSLTTLNFISLVKNIQSYIEGILILKQLPWPILDSMFISPLRSFNSFRTIGRPNP